MDAEVAETDTKLANALTARAFCHDEIARHLDAINEAYKDIRACDELINALLDLRNLSR